MKGKYTAEIDRFGEEVVAELTILNYADLVRTRALLSPTPRDSRSL